MNILNISNNLYKDWLSYEGEYINEEFESRNDIYLLKWGQYRDGINQSLRYMDSLDSCIGSHFKGSFPDVVIVSINDIFTMKVGHNILLLDWIKSNRKRFMLLIRINDPWRFHDKVKTVVFDLFADCVFIPSLHYKKIFEDAYLGVKTRFYVLPYCVGRRYLNFGIDREYDIAMIGRCQINSKIVNPYRFKIRYRVYAEKKLSTVRRKLGRDQYFDRVMNTVINLNKAKTSFNSPVFIKDDSSVCHVPFRYLESAACGSISLSTMSFSELNNLYFPKNTYIDCKNSIRIMKKNIDFIKKNPEDFYNIQSSAYKFVMNNHQASNRVDFIVDLIKGRSNIQALDYYRLSI